MKAALLVAGLSVTGCSMVGCSTPKATVSEEQVIEEEEPVGRYGFSSISKTANRTGSDYIGFFKESYDVMGYPTTGFVHYEKIDEFSVLQSASDIYIVKDYEEGKQVSNYYDYLRDSSVKVADSFTVSSLQEYMRQEEELFSAALVDSYLHFQLYDTKELLEEERLSVTELASSRGEPYIEISRNASTQRNVGIVSYAPVSSLSILKRDTLYYLVEDYDPSSGTIARQYDLLKGSSAPSGDHCEVYDFSEYVLGHADFFSPELVTYLQAADLSQNYCLAANDFVGSLEKSFAQQQEAKLLTK